MTDAKTGLWDRTVNAGFPTDEPSLRQMVEHYYRSHDVERWKDYADALIAQYAADAKTVCVPVPAPASVNELLGFVKWALEHDHPVNPEHIVSLCDALKDAYRAQPVSPSEAEPVAWRRRVLQPGTGAGNEWVLYGRDDGDFYAKSTDRYEIQPLYANPSDPSATERMRAAAVEPFRAWYRAHVGKMITRANAEKAIAIVIAALAEKAADQ